METLYKLQKCDLSKGILLIQLPQVSKQRLDINVAKNRGYFAYPPQGLLYISKILSNIEVNSSILDLNYIRLENVILDKAEELKELLVYHIDKHCSGIVFITYMFDATYEDLLYVSSSIRDIDKNIIIICGGVAATANYENLLKINICDFVYINEAESSLSELIEFIQGIRHFPPSNICYIDKKGNFQKTAIKFGGEVDVDITTEYHKIPIGDYHKVGSVSGYSRMVGIDIPFATILTRRGCRGKCSFCSVRNFNGKSVRVREVNSILNEMIFLNVNYSIKHFELLDDDFLYDKESVIILLTKIIDYFKGTITWSANNGLIASTIDADVLLLFAKSNCIGFKVGLESGNPEILKKIHKPISLNKYFEFTKLIRSNNQILISTNFILGFPNENFAQMLDTYKVALEGNMMWNNFYTYQHFKNTELDFAYQSVETRSENSLKGMFSPARFGEFNLTDGSKIGYEIFEYQNDYVPNNNDLKEIWFTFNTIVNFFNNPVLKSNDRGLLYTMLRWIGVLLIAYPNDCLMLSLEFYIKQKLDLIIDLEIEKNKILELIKLSPYWTARENQFNYSKLITSTEPSLKVCVS